MNKVKWSSFLCVSAMVLLALSSIAHADLVCEYASETKGMFGQPDKTQTVTTYYTPHATRSNAGDAAMIMDFKTMDMYNLNTANKTYTKMNLNEMGDQMAAAAKMMGNMKVTATNETKTIAGYKCKKYVMKSMMGETEFWVSKDVKGADELMKISKKLAKSFENNPIMSQMSNIGMINKMDGFPVQTITKIMGGSSTTTLTSIKKKSVNKDLLTVPAGYTQKEMKQFGK